MPTESELKDARAFLLTHAAPLGAPTKTFEMTDPNVAAAKKLRDEGLVTTSDGEIDGILRLGVRLTDAGVEHLAAGGR